MSCRLSDCCRAGYRRHVSCRSLYNVSDMKHGTCTLPFEYTEMAQSLGLKGLYINYLGFYPCRNKHATIGIHGEISETSELNKELSQIKASLS